MLGVNLAQSPPMTISSTRNGCPPATLTSNSHSADIGVTRRTFPTRTWYVPGKPIASIPKYQ
jgi:hypothetical protein